MSETRPLKVSKKALFLPLVSLVTFPPPPLTSTTVISQITRIYALFLVSLSLKKVRKWDMELGVRAALPRAGINWGKIC